jgi:drug/metabolite transporter (DMT)-like permease
MESPDCVSQCTLDDVIAGALTGAFLSLSAAAVWGGGDFSGGIAAKRANVFKVVAGAHACGLVLMLLLAWLTGEAMPPASSLGWGVVAGLTGAFGIAALYKGLAIGRMGVVAPVASVVTAVLPVIFGFRIEGLPHRLQLAGFALALVSIWLIARPDGQIDSHRGLGLAIVAGVMFGLFLISGKQAGVNGVFWPLVAARAASTLLMLLIVAFLPPDPRPLRPALLAIVLSGLADSGANALFLAATRHGRLDVAAVLSSLYPASTVILARVLLKEKISRSQTVGIVGALAAVALISSR